MAISRRAFLQTSSAAAALSLAPGLTLAAAPTDARLVLVILRGGLDGLTAVPPYGDRRYAELRPTIALNPPGEKNGAIPLDGVFGLHPSLAPLQALYRDGELAILPANATSYRGRSHFDGQNQLENGTPRPYGAEDGWLNRALARLGGEDRLGLALGNTVPLVARGPVGVRTWAPTTLPPPDDDFLARLASIYADDKLFREALAEGIKSQKSMAGMMGNQRGRGRGANALAELAKVAGQLLAQDGGPRVAVLETTGWDTHAGETGALNGLLKNFAAGVVALKDALGPAWRKTAFIAVTEFGRTVAENGTRGTDHGTGGASFLAGGAIAGGRFIGEWRGLSESALLDARDVTPTVDTRAVFKGLLRDHLGLDEAALEDTVFPGSREAPGLGGLLRG